MSESFFARITPLRRPGGGPVDPGYGVEGPGGPVDPDYGLEGPGGGSVEPPIVIPPLPGVWPPPGKPSLPIYVPKPPRPGVEPPIVLEPTPEHPITLPPGVVWPPLPPDLNLGEKKAILIWVLGVGARWYIYDPALRPEHLPSLPNQPQPKR